MFGDKEVVGGGFGDVAVVGEHEGFEGAGVAGFEQGEDVVEVVVCFDVGIEESGIIASDVSSDGDINALLVSLRGIEGDGGGHDVEGRGDAFGGIDAEVSHAPGEDWTEISGCALGIEGGFGELNEDVAKLCARVWERDFESLCGVNPSVDMFFEHEDSSVVDAYALKDGVAVEVSVVERTESGFVEFEDAIASFKALGVGEGMEVWAFHALRGESLDVGHA